MKGQKILAFVCSLMLVSNQIPFSVFSVNAVEEESEKTSITLDEDFAESLVAESKIYDGTPLVNVDFSNVHLDGLADEHDVELTGVAEFSDVNAGQQKEVVVSDLALQGDDAELYILNLTDEQDEIILTADITPIVLYVKPKEGIIEGETVPKEISYTWTEDKVLEGDSVDVNAKLYIDKDATGAYTYTLSDENAVTNSNYTLAIEEGVTVPVSSPEAPEIDKKAIVSMDTASVLEYCDFGIVANGSVKLSVSAKSSVPVTLTLYNEQNELESIEVTTGEKIDGERDMQLYTAEFILDIPENQMSTTLSSLKCSASNGVESEVGLEIKLSPDDDRFSHKLILDKKESAVNNMLITYDDIKQQFEAKGQIVDTESGIKKIEFKWDDQNWEEYKNITNQPNVPVNFNDIVLYRESQDVSYNNGLHTLYFRITDNANNVHTESDLYCSSQNGPDTKAPIITYAKLETTDETPLATVLKILTFGNYTNQKLQLVIKALDTSYSDHKLGIEYVAIMDGADNAKEISRINGDEGEYCFLLDPEKFSEPVIEDFYIEISDGQNPLRLSLQKALKDYAPEETESNDTTSSTDETTETTETTTVPTINWDDVVSNKWVFDNHSPIIMANYANKKPVNSVYYYGDDGGNFTLTITDEGGLDVDETVITQNYRLTASETGENSVIEITACKQIENGYEYVVDTSKLDTGFYTFSVSAQDYAGNAPASGSYQFYVDHEQPEGSITVASPSVKQIDENDWITEKDASGNYQDVIFRLYADSNGAPLYGGKVSINNQDYQQITADKFKLIEDTADAHYGKYYVDIFINTETVKCNDAHTYMVDAEFWTESNNKGSASYVLHVDTSNPDINRFTVDTKNNAVDNLLNVLTFGVFASDSLVFSVDVSDVENDSGVDYVTIKHDGLEEPQKMTKESEGKYYAYLDIDTQVFQSEIEVTVYDKMGKTNLKCPNIKNTEGTVEVQGNFVMLETVPPEVTVILPETDSVTRTDGEVWYRQHKNSETDTEKLIVLQVKDVNSGIRSVEMKINGEIVSSEMEINQAALPTVEATSNANTAMNSQEGYLYSYSLEKIAEMIPANEDGSYIIEVEVVDNAGNVNSNPVDSDGNTYPDAKPIYYRDIVNPSVVQFTFAPATSDDISEVTEFIEELEYGFYFKKGFDAVVSVTDEVPSSDLDRVVFRLVPYVDGEEQEAELHEVVITDGKASYTIPAGFKGQIYAQAYDKVGNISDEKTPQGFVIDDVAPVITIEPLPDSTRTDENNNKLYTGTVQFRVTVSDPKSGLKEISYSKSSEQDSYDAVVNTISNTDGYSENMLLANGWEITKTDVNLITEVSQVFTFNTDDNNIVMTFNAMDRAANACDSISSEAFSIDTIAPVVAISNNAELINGMYYPGSTAFTITVTERNFDPGLMVATITNGFTGTIPSVNFQSNGSTHTATVSFSEGDFEFSFSGTDRAGHSANITYNGGEVSNYFYEMFNVDATAPIIKTNFNSFGDDADEGIYFNTEQIAKIEVVEHNFDASDMGILVETKASGTGHSAADENWHSIGYSTDWKHDGDTHTLEIPFAADGVYRIKIVPIDRAGNKGVMEEGSVDHTPIYEVDTTAPVFYARNDELSTEKDFVVSPYFAVYDEKLKDAAAPTVEFTDLNFDRIEIEAQVYTPTYENGMELGTIEMSPLAADLSKSISQSKFTLNGFDKDGVYAFTFVAVDKAGNRSEVISDTYFRMVETDVLAYIYNSKKPTDSGTQDGTGYYSLVNDDGRAISKKAADFQNLDILVIKPTTDNAAGTLVLREDENQYSPQEYLTIENEELSETATLSYIQLPGNYFSETFRDDSLDTRMYLSVSIRDDVYLDLAAIHIDNEAPTATLPEDFKDWHNYFFKDEVTISLTDISETLDKHATKVYECPRDGERTEIPSTYDPETDTLSFTLTKGQHHIDITLVDEAGNEWNIDRVRYLQVGNFWLYIGGAVLVVIVAGIGFFVWRKKKR